MLLYITIYYYVYFHVYIYIHTYIHTHTHTHIHTCKAADTYTHTGKATDLGLAPLAKIVGFADAEQAPVDFTTAPSLALPKALAMAGMEVGHVDLFELNQAFSVRTVPFYFSSFFLSPLRLFSCLSRCALYVCVSYICTNAYTHACTHITTHA